MSRGRWVALPRGAVGCLQFVIVVFPNHTHLLYFEFRYQIIVSSIKFRKGFARFMIPLGFSRSFFVNNLLRVVKTVT